MKTLHENVTFPIGNNVMLDRIQKDYGYFDFMFGKIGGKAKDFQKNIKSSSEDECWLDREKNFMD